MTKRDRSVRGTLPELEDDKRAEDRAWSVYQANSEWIARVDLKASILLAFQGLVIGAMVAASSSDHEIVHLSNGPARTLFAIAVALLGAAIVVALFAVMPRVKGSRRSRFARRDYAYFDDARHFTVDAVAAELRRSALPMLARQIVATASIAGRKHLLVRWSVWLSLLAGLGLAAAALVSTPI